MNGSPGTLGKHISHRFMASSGYAAVCIVPVGLIHIRNQPDEAAEFIGGGECRQISAFEQYGVDGDITHSRNGTQKCIVLLIFFGLHQAVNACFYLP